MQQSPEPRPPVARLAIGVVIAGLGAVLLLAGLLGAISRSGPESAAGPSGSPAAPGSDSGAPSASRPAPSSPGASSPGASAAPSPAGDPVLVGAGDIARCDGTDDEATAALLEQTPGLVFTLGDNAYDSGTVEEFRDCYGPSWGRVLDRTAFAVAGNHDYGTTDAAGFTSYFGTAAVRDGTTWFSQDVGTWHVIVLDANCDKVGGCAPDSPQGRWLSGDLGADRSRCTLAMWHQPRFSSGAHGDDGSVGPFWGQLYAAGADLVLNGHDHDYERFAPQNPEGEWDPSRGITEVVVGTGGAGLRDFDREADNSIIRSNLAHGVLVLTLRPSGWAFRFVSSDGSFSDQGTGACH